MNKFENIPLEMREHKAWVLWKYENNGEKKPTKVPYTIRGNRASVTNPNDWSDFATVVAVFQFGGYDGIGFVFSKNDPYAFIDLDDTEDKIDTERQLKIFNEFNSYSERSPSGRGLHVIVKGSIPKGKKHAHIEIYSNERYATMTGDVYANKAIVDHDNLLNQLYDQMSKPPVLYSNSNLDEPQTISDEEVLKQASNAINGKKFNDLYRGEWKDYYPKQASAGQGSSEADFALVDIISFYTQNRNQIQRIFFSSELGKKDKYSKRSELVAKMIERSFDQRPPKIDFDGFKNALEEKLEQQRAEQQSKIDASVNNGVSYLNGHSTDINSILATSDNGSPTPFDGGSLGSNPSVAATKASVAQSVEPAPHKSQDASSNLAASTIPFPPGLLGEIAQFIYDAAPRQVEEVAIAGAIGLMSGICGRAYNTSTGTGLNQYILLLAKTGRGKDAITSGIDKIMNEVVKCVPTANEFIGPEIINSGQALTRYISTQSSCFVSVLGEFGFTIERISKNDANSADKMLYSNLLSLYSRSGFGQIFKASIYSKKDDSVAATISPAVTILGESNPTTFYNAIDETMVLAGLLPRFLMIEYDGNRKYFNESSINIKPSDQLISRVSQLSGYCKEVIHRKSVINVELNHEAKIKMTQYDKQTTDIINLISHPAIDELWNRAHLKVLKLASIVAIGINPFNPIITIDELNWAIPIVERDIKSLAHKFDVGEVGKNTEEIKQYEDAIRILREYVTKDSEYALKYRGHAELHKDRVVCNTFLSDRLKKLSSFKCDKIGATNALKKMMQVLIDNGIIAEVPHTEKVKRKYTYVGKCYAIISV